MRRTSLGLGLVIVSSSLLGLALAGGGCSAGEEPDGTGAGNSTGTNGEGGGFVECPRCEFNQFVGCDGTTIDCDDQELTCAPSLGGCAECNPGTRVCVGNEVHECADDGTPNGPLVETCDLNAGFACSDGACKTPCEVAADQATNVGCEFFAVDLDQQDGGGNDPASMPWGLAISNVGAAQANVTIEMNEGEPGQALSLVTIPNGNFSVPPGSLYALNMPTRELDCGAAPNQYASPGTCLSSRAFRITSSAPVVVYQFNVFENQYSNDASLLLPTHSLGQQYRVLGWNAGHPAPVPLFDGMIDRSYITVVGTEAGTTVTVVPKWKIRGNAPIPATPAGQPIQVTLGPFDVLNLETDDAALSDDPKTVADLSGSFVYADKPIAVFSGVESTSAPYGWDIPTYPGYDSEATGSGCCLDHLEDQMFPLESLGSKYVIARSPVRSTSSYREPDMIRFVGGAEASTVTTTGLTEGGFQSFTLQPGEVRTTYAQGNVTAVGDKPFLVGQVLISQGYVDGPNLGDPALTTFPPVDQYRTEYILLTPGSWSQNWVVITAEVGSNVSIDGTNPANCTTEPAGTVDGKTYESRRCPMPTEFGAHSMSGDAPFGITAYGYGSAGSYAIAGGADLKKIYNPPVPE